MKQDMENTKICNKCGKELPLDQFHKRTLSNGGVGRQPYCRSCKSAICSRRYLDNKERIDAACNKWRRANIDRALKQSALWRQDNPKYRSNYDRERRLNDFNYRVINNIRSFISGSLRRNIRAGHTVELLGCSIEYLRLYLEGQFTEGMTWDNYGRHGWHIDHIIPLSYFDFTDPEQQKRAWHYTNLRPLWAIDNLRKNNKIVEIQLVLL